MTSRWRYLVASLLLKRLQFSTALDRAIIVTNLERRAMERCYISHLSHYSYVFHSNRVLTLLNKNNCSN